MKKSSRLLLLFFLLAITANAQEIQKSIASFVNETNAIVTINENTEIVNFVKFQSANPLVLEGGTLEQKVFQFLEKYKGIFNMNSVEDSFIVEGTKTDTYGFQHITFNQVYNGVAVYDGQLKFHFNSDNKLTSINGNFIPNIKLSALPNIPKETASSVAMEAVGKQNINTSRKPLKVNKNTLYVFQKGLAQGNYTSKHLVYEVEIRNDVDVREFVFVDAHSQEIVEQFTGMANALHRIVYEDNTSNIVWEEGDALPGTLSNWQLNEVETSAQVYYLFNNTFGFDSYDGSGAQMRTVNNDPNVANASWNGSTTNYRDGTAADDVIAHEWGHAYTEYTSGLIYAWQAGAINESYSDIWGETIDLLNNYEDEGEDFSLRTGCSSSDRWRMGEDATYFSAAIRDLWDPTCNGDPGKLTDAEYHCSDSDSGGVHVNSGVPNHAYALLVDGGTYNGQTINGIGFTKAAHIFWRAQSTYLSATSDFSVLADALETSCIDLIGIDLPELVTTNTTAGASGEIITVADYDELVKVLLAVEIRILPEQCNFTAILQEVPELCEPATNNAVFFEDWESGLGNWVATELPSNASTWESRPWSIDANLPNGRNGQAVFGADPVNGDCATDLQNGIIRLESPLITLPDFTEGVFEMAFDHYVATESQWDGGNIKYSVTNGLLWNIVPSSAFTHNPYNNTLNTNGNDNPLQGQEAFTGTNGGSIGGSWGKSIIDLSAIGVGANSTVKFRWELGTDGCNGRVGWYLDDVVIYNCDKALSVTNFEALNNSIKVYPNPSNGLFTILKTQNINLSTASIHDINGRFIKQIDLTNMQKQKDINISNLASGIYFMTVASSESKAVIKLVKK
ncbi:M4 family metallopeptidase [Oceanihabitans sp. 2_MG-2023]|uniref:M4 family metallopeptidase n=1 Tax=Oceanihabitans sp. 2_MG-2023 TaxID=3062661 RepID=UPI0026E43741|nr:M4 family metallopeptidase [Oceanihabitans sp. 2_MG-2023]MDO6598111.1 M4 family metallopeptidase [Oceanihabitans sp. 2_MG-2023]